MSKKPKLSNKKISIQKREIPAPIKKATILSTPEKEDTNENKVVSKKSCAKRLGLRSIFVCDDKLYYTSQKHDEIEKITLNSTITSGYKKISSSETYDIENVSEKSVLLSSLQSSKSPSLKSDVVNPSYNKNGVTNDQLGLKKYKENFYFEEIGKNENIRIQISYKIDKIKTLLNYYVQKAESNFLYLNRDKTSLEYKTFDDIIGMNTDSKKTYDVFKKAGSGYSKFKKYFDETNKHNYFKYFSEAFTKGFFDKNTPIENKERECFNIVRTLSLFRQSCAHVSGKNSRYLFNLENDSNIKDLVKFIERLYETLNKRYINDFVENSKLNLNIIFSKLNAKTEEDKKAIFNQFFHFNLEKNSSNLGFSYRKFKERVLEKAISFNPTNKDTASYSTIFSFFVYHELIKSENDSFRKEIRARLIESKNEEEKDQIYDEYSKKFVNKISKLVNKETLEEIVNIKKEKHKTACENFIDNSSIYLVDNLENLTDGDSFSKMIFYLSIFLSEKETNMLFTDLINKMEQISLLNGYAEGILECDFRYKQEYKMFNNDSLCKTIKSLKYLYVLARLQKRNKKSKIKKNGSLKEKEGDDDFSKANISYNQLRDALIFVGDLSDKKLSDFISEISQEDKYQRTSVKRFLNFITSTIINNNMFKLICENIDPADAKKIISNEKISKYILNKLPEKQLSDLEPDGNSKKNIIDSIYDKYLKNDESLIKLRDEYHEKRAIDIKNKNNTKTSLFAKKLKLKMTISYMAIKEFYVINNLFSIAFNALERDYFCKYKEDQNSITHISDEDYLKLAIEYNNIRKTNYENKKIEVERGLRKSLAQRDRKGISNYRYISNNIEEFKKLKLNENDLYNKTYRNIVQHIGLLRETIWNHPEYIDEFKCNTEGNTDEPMNSTFELYVYLLQRYFIDHYQADNVPDIFNKYKDEVESKKTYSKNLLHIMNTPFTYCLSRYKNLSIEDLFNDNYSKNKNKKNINNRF